MDNLILVYQDTSVLKEIQKEVDKVSSFIVNTEKLEFRIYEQLASYFGEFEHRSFARIRKIITREIQLAKKQFRKQHTVLFSDLVSQSNSIDSDGSEYDPPDVLVDVSENVISKVAVADIKKELGSLVATEKDVIILNELYEGYGETQIAKTLVGRLGGKENTRRQQVRRFRMKCQSKLGLASAI